jgi:hypothetical protein
MPKAEAGSLKDMANKSKARGLQKLRFYCQMCEKQCRDENGFKCHTLSEGHLRQMALFAANPERFMDQFSADFDTSFMRLLSQRFGTRCVAANLVYNEHIQDKEHVHMNATMWPTLTDYVKYLGRTGKVVAEETERGWFITYIDRDPEAVRRAERVAQRREQDSAQAARVEDEVEAQAAAAAAALAAAQGVLEGPEGGEGEEGSSSSSSSSYKRARGASSSAAAHALAPGLEAEGSDPAAPRLGVKLGLSVAQLRGAGVPRQAFFGGEDDEEEEEEEEEEGEREDREEGVNGEGPSAAAAAAAAAAPSVAGTKRSRWDTGASVAASATAAAPAASAAAGGGGGAARAPSALPSLHSFMAEEQAARARLEARRVAAESAAAAAAAASAAAAAAAAAAPSDHPWLLPGISVRVINASVGGGAYHKAKGVVTEVEEGGYVGRVQLASGDVLRLDCADLETVIPAVGGGVLVLRGAHRGAQGTLAALHVDRFCADVQLGALLLRGLEYTDFSKCKG